MDADLNALATALYVTTDDLLVAHPEHVPARPKVGIAPRTSDAEMLTLAGVTRRASSGSQTSSWNRRCGAPRRRTWSGSRPFLRLAGPWVHPEETVDRHSATRRRIARRTREVEELAMQRRQVFGPLLAFQPWALLI